MPSLEELLKAMFSEEGYFNKEENPDKVDNLKKELFDKFQLLSKQSNESGATFIFNALGIKPNDVEVELDPCGEINIMAKSIYYGNLKTVIKFNKDIADTENIIARLDEGTLVIFIPFIKKEKPKVTKIKVK